METYILKKSDKPTKKFVIIMNDGRMKHYFGQAGMKDFTLHDRDVREARKKAYISRTKNQPQDNIHSPAFWSLNLLWNKPTIRQSISDVEKRLKIKIKDER